MSSELGWQVMALRESPKKAVVVHHAPRELIRSVRDFARDDGAGVTS